MTISWKTLPHYFYKQICFVYVATESIFSKTWNKNVFHLTIWRTILLKVGGSLFKTCYFFKNRKLCILFWSKYNSAKIFQKLEIHHSNYDNLRHIIRAFVCFNTSGAEKLQPFSKAKTQEYWIQQTVLSKNVENQRFGKGKKRTKENFHFEKQQIRRCRKSRSPGYCAQTKMWTAYEGRKIDANKPSFLRKFCDKETGRTNL